MGIFFRIAFLALLANVTFSSENDFDFKSLAWKDRAALYVISKLNPKIFEGMPQELLSEISERPDIVSIDNFFVDARQLFTQAIKVPETANHPEIYYRERISFCFWFFCLDLEISIKTGNTRFYGTDSITTSTNFTPTYFQNTFHIPSFNWTSPGFTINVTNYIYEEIDLHQNTFISFEDTTIIFRGDYKFVPDVGIQLDNVAIFFDAGHVRWHISDLTHWDFMRNLLERFDPIETDGDEAMMDNWTWAKRNYVPGLQYSLNCFLSNGRSDPEGCDANESEYNDYYRLLNMELVQSIGLGALLSS